MEPAFCEQQLHKAVQKREVFLSWLERKWIDARPSRLPYRRGRVELDHALVAVAYVEDVGEAAVLLLARQHLVGMHALTCAGRPDDELHANPVHIGVLKKGRALPGLKDIEVLGSQILGVRMPDAGREDGREARVVVLAQPQIEHPKLLIARNIA